jgi:hypothetical protein
MGCAVVHSASSIEAAEDFRDMFFSDGVDWAVASLGRIRHRIVFSFPELNPNGQTIRTIAREADVRQERRSPRMEPL